MASLRRAFADSAHDAAAARCLPLTGPGPATSCSSAATTAATWCSGHLSVSRRHARLSFRDGHWVLRDLDSTNGTRVNGQRVIRCRLEPGDRLRLGSAELLVD